MRYTSLVLTLLLCGVNAEPLAASSMIPQQKKAWTAPGRKAKVNNVVPNSAEAVERGRLLYVSNCVACHGESGKGDGAASVALTPKPADFSLPALQTQTDGSIYWKLSKGRAPMPGFDPALTDTQRWELVHYLRSFGPPPTPEAQSLSAYENLRFALKKGQAKDFNHAAKELQQDLLKLMDPSKQKGLEKKGAAVLQKKWSAQIKKTLTLSKGLYAKDFEWVNAPSRFGQLTQELAALIDLLPKQRMPSSLTLWKNTTKEGGQEYWMQPGGEKIDNPYSAERRKSGKAEKSWRP